MCQYGPRIFSKSTYSNTIFPQIEAQGFNLIAAIQSDPFPIIFIAAFIM